MTIRSVQYNLPDPPQQLTHKPMGLLERLVSLVMSSHICQICRRKEIWSVSGWLQIDHSVYKDQHNCSVVCLECARANPDVFGSI